MKDFVFESIKTTTFGGFAIEEYCEKFNYDVDNLGDKNIFGGIITADDEPKSTNTLIETVIKADAVIIVFDIQSATAQQIYHIRQYFKLKHPEFEDTAGLYESRLCFMKK